MEFTRYAEDTTATMSELDFSRHLLYSSSISQKKKEKMMKRVAEEFKGENARGISFDSFLTFYNILFGGADLERAMFFLDEEHFGVTRDEFIKVANWVVGVEVDPHVVEVNITVAAFASSSSLIILLSSLLCKNKTNDHRWCTHCWTRTEIET